MNLGSFSLSMHACTTFWMEIDEPQEESESVSLSKKAKGQGSRPYLLTHSLSLLFISISFPSFLQIYHLSEKITMSHYPIIGSNVLGFFKNSKPFRGGQVPVRVIPEAEAEGLCEPEMPEPEFQIELPGSVGRLRNVLDPWLSLLRKVGGVGTEGLELFSSLGKLTLLSQPC